MAVDDAAFTNLSKTVERLPTVRVYQWDRPAVSLGRMQNEDSARRLYPDLPLVRRPTGGRAVLHGQDLTVSVVTRCEWLPDESGLGILSSYRQIMNGLIQALNNSGVPTAYAEPRPFRQTAGIVNCFDIAGACDLVDRRSGCKIVGSAQRREGARTQFLLECLADLDGSLRERGGGLVVRHGPPERELARLAGEVGASELHFTADISPFARERGERTRTALADAGVELHEHTGLNAIDEVGSPRTQSDKPYTVFTPFHRTWEQQDRRAVLARHARCPRYRAAWRRGASRRLTRSACARRSASRRPAASAARASGCRAFSSATSPATGRAATRSAKTRRRACRRICTSAAFRRARSSRDWRAARGRRRFAASCAGALYHHVLLHFPRNAHSEFQQRYRGKLRWSRAQRRFAAWCDGQTGFPLVDAGMRQLLREGGCTTARGWSSARF